MGVAKPGMLDGDPFARHLALARCRFFSRRLSRGCFPRLGDSAISHESGEAPGRLHLFRQMEKYIGIVRSQNGCRFPD